MYPEGITSQLLIKSLLPNCFCNNWYISCCILFLLIYPALNNYPMTITKKEHLSAVFVTSFLWIIGNYFKGDWFFPSKLLLWVSIYFLIAYLKLYCESMMSNIKTGICLVIIGTVGSIMQVLITNYVGVFWLDVMSDKILRWNSDNCPFFLLIAIGALILSSQIKWKSRTINTISKLSIFVYLVHENILFRTYSRPMIWSALLSEWGVSNIVICDLIFSICLFIASLIVAFIYNATIQKVVIRVSNLLYSKIIRVKESIEFKLQV